MIQTLESLPTLSNIQSAEPWFIGAFFYERGRRMTTTYRIADNFTETPGGRFKAHGNFSGEEFREEVLRGLLSRVIADGDKLVVVLDGAAGYGSSFLEEAFGGLIRRRLFNHEQLKRHLELKAEEPLYEMYRLSANRYMERARPAN